MEPLRAVLIFVQKVHLMPYKNDRPVRTTRGSSSRAVKSVSRSVSSLCGSVRPVRQTDREAREDAEASPVRSWP